MNETGTNTGCQSNSFQTEHETCATRHVVAVARALLTMTCDQTAYRENGIPG
jgi:hypothetical protein